MEAKIEYVIKIRLERKAKFRAMEVNGRHDTFKAAQERVASWHTMVADLPKAKPEAVIEVEELPHLRDCNECGNPLFKGDICYFTERVICFTCAKSLVFYNGYYDTLELELNSLDTTL